MMISFKPNCTVVGNAELTDAERSEIRWRAQGSTVVRFNDLNHALKDDITNVHVVRLPSAWSPRFAVTAPKLYVTPCDRFLPDADVARIYVHEPQYSSCTRGPRRIFATSCAACGDRCNANSTYAGPSTGAALLSFLQNMESVATIHVYGMNWNGSPDMHIDFADATLVRDCCTKCVVHPTSSLSYGAEWPAYDVIALAMVGGVCAACAVRRIVRWVLTRYRRNRLSDG